jgi:hypothetical protein
MHAPPRVLTATERWVLRLTPALGIAAVAAIVLLTTGPDARWARVYVGPTDQPSSLVWRIAVKQGAPRQNLEVLRAGEVTAVFGPGQVARAPYHTDADGVAWVTLARPAGASASSIEVLVTEGQRALAAGRVQVTAQQWLAHARRDGGWCSGRHEGRVAIRVGAVRGVLLHGYPAPIVLELSDQGRPLPNQAVFVEAEGAVILGAREAAKLMLLTDAAGSARLTVRTTDMAATLSVNVPPPYASRLTAALPIRAGGLHVEQTANALVVSTTVGPTHAWLGLLSEHGLLDVWQLDLTGTGGRFSATTQFPQSPPMPLWAVVSSEPELESGNTIGWPLLAPTDTTDAHSTLVAPEVLALDGRRQVEHRLAQQRARVIATSSSILLVVAALVAWVVVRSNRRHQLAVSELARHLDAAKPVSLADQTPVALIAVVITIAALVALAYWVSF